MKANLAWLMSRFALIRRTLALTILTAFTLSMLFAFNALGGDPVVSNVRASQRAGTKLVDITCDVTAIEAVTISAAVSTNVGLTYDLPATHFSGDYGSGVAPGTGKAIVWDAGADWDGHYNAQMRVKVTADDGTQPVIPPDPATVANAPENGVVSLFSANISFLYSGTNAIQTGVATGTIQALQVAVLRGRVLERSGAVMPGVTISINGHVEYGQTVSRTNGCYDLAINGGGVLSVNFHKNGYLDAQRTVTVPWQEFMALDDVTLIQSDMNVTAVTLPSTNLQVAYGSLVSDQDGSRRVVVMIPAGVTASIFTRSGETQQVNALTTRFTEYTVGTNGPNAMPGDLPANVAYTYAIELGTDEAQAKVAGKDVLFSTNVFLYIDNFLKFPTGISVPMGYYDNDRAAWVAAPDGRVIQLLGTNAAGLALISVNTNGTESDTAALAALGFTDAERRQLAVTYPPATNSLWRFPMTHFSRCDPNPSWITSGNATAPNQPQAGGNQTINDGTDQGNLGTIEIENRIFRESIPIVGTPYTLNYASDRVPGRLATLFIPLSSNTIPASLKRIDLTVVLAGNCFTNSFSPAPNLSYEFTWNGRDIYGRTLKGQQLVLVRIGYVYEAYYGLPPDVAASWGLPSVMAIPGANSRRDLTLNQDYVTTIRYSTPTVSQGLGGWTLSVHHAYDPLYRTVELGDGQRQSGEELVYDTIITTVAGDGYDDGGYGRFAGDGGPATNASLSMPERVRVAPDGSYYIVDTDNYRIRKVDTNGIIRTVAGSIRYPYYRGDGGPATNACLDSPTDVAVAPDGSFYIADHDNHVIRKVDTNGIITTVVGDGYGAGGNPGRYAGDGGPATNASLYMPESVAVAPDGTLFIADTANYRIRRVGTDGIIYSIAGDGTAGYSGDGGPAVTARVSGVSGLTLASDGTLYIADEAANHRIRKISTDGIIRTVAGNGIWAYSGDGGLATNASLSSPTDVTIARDGSLYIADYFNHRIRRVAQNGIITTIAGNGGTNFSGDTGPATDAGLKYPTGVAATPDGKIYVSTWQHHRVRCIQPALPGVGVGDVLIPSSDGQWIYVFTETGRHLRTHHALTGAIVFSFSYSSAGHLTEITDGDGNGTTIEREADGTPTGIVGPYNQSTTLALNGDGYLASVQNPASETMVLGYTTNGLLTSVQGPRGSACTYTISYNAAGYVIQGTEPAGAGGYTALGRESLSDGFQVASTTALGRVTISRIENLTTGDRRRLKTLPDNTQVETLEMANGTQTNRTADGAVTGMKYGPDPRFGMKAPVLAQQVVRLPSGLVSTSVTEQTASLTNDSPLSLVALTNKTIVNGRTNTSIYLAAGRVTTLTTPVGRQTQILRDTQGRQTFMQKNGLAAVTNTYDVQGRLTVTTRGSGANARTKTRYYNSDGFVDRIVDAMGRTNAFVYDMGGRVLTNSMPGDRLVSYRYDEQGNRISVTPPGQSAHTFGYSPVDLITNYTAPGAAALSTVYNADREVTQVARPGGQVISFGHDAAGKPGTNTIAEDQYRFAYLTNGLLASLSATSGVAVTYQYDGFLNTNLLWTGVVTGLIGMAYDNDCRMVAQVMDGTAYSFGYDADGLLVNAGSCTYVRSATNGLLMSSTLGVVTDAYAYNEFGEVTNYAASTNGNPVYAYACAYDPLGRITNRVEIIMGVTSAWAYAYDLAGRLAQVVTNDGSGGGCGTNMYAYDANGNRTNCSVGAIVFIASNDVQDRLQSTASSLQTNVYSYNAAGDLTNVVVNGTSITYYTCDALGALRQVVLPDGGPVTNITYLIDGRSRRIGKRVDGLFTNGWIYADSISPIAELGATTNLVSVFVYGRRANVPDYLARASVNYRILMDHLGSPRLIVRADTGEIAQRLDYDEWGRVLTNSAPGFQPFGFAGGLYDQDTGLVRFGARDYAPDCGRWQAKDPLLFSGGNPNLYAYCSGDPVNQMDPLGFGPGDLGPLILLGVGEGGSYLPASAAEEAAAAERAAARAFLEAVNEKFHKMRALRGQQGVMAFLKANPKIAYLIAAAGGYLIGTAINEAYPEIGAEVAEYYGWNWYWEQHYKR